MSRIMLFPILFCALILQGSAPGNKEFPQTKIPYAPLHYVCYRADVPLNIDGKLDESPWQAAAWTEEFVDIEGSLKPVPPYKTRAKMLWDDMYLYVGAFLEEPHVWAKLHQRDTVIFYDNDFEIFIDPDGDTHEYFEFEMNAFSTEWDLFLTKPYRDGASAMDGYDMAGLKTAVHVVGTINDPGDTDEGWFVEVALPWRAFKDCAHMPLPPKNTNQWRIGFSRVEWQTEVINGNYRKKINPKTGRSFPEDNWVWSPQGLIAMHAPETWGFLQFSTEPAGKKEVAFITPEDDHVKWALRKAYYDQHTYRMNHDAFTADFGRLNCDIKSVDGYTWPPKVMVTDHCFEMSTQRLDGTAVWHIIQDGKVWKTPAENE